MCIRPLTSKSAKLIPAYFSKIIQTKIGPFSDYGKTNSNLLKGKLNNDLFINNVYYDKKKKYVLIFILLISFDKQ